MKQVEMSTRRFVKYIES
jgi:hypothetical protein